MEDEEESDEDVDVGSEGEQTDTESEDDNETDDIDVDETPKHMTEEGEDTIRGAEDGAGSREEKVQRVTAFMTKWQEMWNS